MFLNDKIFWIIILSSSAVIDYFVEYPNKIHPVVFTGKFISFFDNHRLAKKPIGEFINGMLAIIVVIIIWIFILYLINLLPIYVKIIIYIYIMKSTFSIGELGRSIKRCETDDLESLRNHTSMIVSRDVKNLDNDHLYSAAFESGSENLVDSVISPLFYFMILGIYGAVIFRVINTADAMIGYRTEKYEYFGKFAARADDVLNFIPARIFGFITIMIKPRRVLNNLKKYKKLKINGMYSMSTVAAIFNVSIEKIGYYFIEGIRFPNIEDLKKLRKFIYVISYFFVVIAITEVLLIGPWWS